MTGSGGDSDEDDVAASYGIYDGGMVGQYLDAYPSGSYYNLTGAPVGSAEGATVALSDTTGDADRWDPYDPIDATVLQLATDSDRAAQMFGLARSGGFTGVPGAHGTGGPDEILARSGHAAGVHVRPEAPAAACTPRTRPPREAGVGTSRRAHAAVPVITTSPNEAGSRTPKSPS